MRLLIFSFLAISTTFGLRTDEIGRGGDASEHIVHKRWATPSVDQGKGAGTPLALANPAINTPVAAPMLTRIIREVIAEVPAGGAVNTPLGATGVNSPAETVVEETPAVGSAINTPAVVDPVLARLKRWATPSADQGNGAGTPLALANPAINTPVAAPVAPVAPMVPRPIREAQLPSDLREPRAARNGGPDLLLDRPIRNAEGSHIRQQRHDPSDPMTYRRGL